ncbi:biotin--[acetyl-CoA-carboxylase] ligase [Nocardioides sp. zg-578]|uniref:biotin--[biotin carboxyl-carrier protein] ligase n=1 Tax=Nocardioides marmotae TaxID=2663857 RepID=A0A6I3JAN3_9ACTN|nr:biotin--[acetyl-CoA-carboxylase] ligase [Nocardioides marmotae]MCR6031386.1 biotin--[acetyl-CoA-carboxylase] ligase [Gordonia jinghuaiqii]MTB86580.1 biotin--[acetyl-CoA-carboxylase] ligase [Nocardioides marmotae]MTB95025.1 biotin--[acetyl-CoA-carboxylase] ligase [Nocardioides marmotae]QKE02476.1 biotin--[acetyl-CoA-carboxylase] ligase [Nocardioides marmotae]
MPVTVSRAERPSLDETVLSALSPDLVPGVSVEVVDRAESTNAVVAERARAGAPEGLVVVTEHQTAGRGRLDRSWETPARSALTFSVLLRPTAPTRSWPWLPLLAGYAVDKALKAAGFDAGVKWPNDVLIGDRKVAGILVERIETEQGPCAVVGIGINVGLTAEELPVPTATSLAIEAGEAGAPDRTALLVGVLASLRESYDTWQAGGDLAGMRLAASYADACVTVGREVRVELPGGSVLTGLATSIDPSGHLVVEGPDGRVAVGAGDVVHVRAAI